MTLLDNIKSSVNSLPSRDVFLAHSFIEQRNFESLLELVNSDIILIEANANNSKSNPMYDACVLADIITLKDLVSTYLDGLTIPELEETEYGY